MHEETTATQLQTKTTWAVNRRCSIASWLNRIAGRDVHNLFVFNCGFKQYKGLKNVLKSVVKEVTAALGEILFYSLMRFTPVVALVARRHGCKCNI
jgi:hypothetical protein